MSSMWTSIETWDEVTAYKEQEGVHVFVAHVRHADLEQVDNIENSIYSHFEQEIKNLQVWLYRVQDRLGDSKGSVTVYKNGEKILYKTEIEKNLDALVEAVKTAVKK